MQVTEFNKSLGEKIAKLRQMNDMSQTDLGARVGLTFQQIQKYENGKNRISAEKLNEFVEIFNTSPLVFFPEFTNESRWPVDREETKLLAIFRAVKNDYHRTKIFDIINILKGAV